LGFGQPQPLVVLWGYLSCLHPPPLPLCRPSSEHDPGVLAQWGVTLSGDLSAADTVRTACVNGVLTIRFTPNMATAPGQGESVTLTHGATVIESLVEVCEGERSSDKAGGRRGYQNGQIVAQYVS